MSNPVFEAFGRQMPGPMGNFQRMMEQYRQFAASFQGDPKAEVQKLLDSGKMSQEQYNQLTAAARMFQGMIR